METISNIKLPDLKLNQTIDININNIFYSCIVSIIKKDCIVATTKFNSHLFVVLKTLKQLDVVVGYKALNTAIRCKVNLLEFIFKKDTIIMALSMPKTISSINRREYYRLQLSSPIPANFQTNVDKDFNLNSCSILDIGGGGLRLETEKSLLKYHIITVNFSLGDKFTVNAEAISCSRNLLKKNYEISFKFIDIQDSVREKIISNIFSYMYNEKKQSKI